MALEALEKYAGRIRLEYHHYPSSDFALTVAEALEAAGEQGKFWQMHSLLIEAVPRDVVDLNGLAGRVGLDMGLFREALADGKYRQKVESSVREAKAKGVEQVALFINGQEYRKYPGTFDDLCAAIEEEMERAQANAR